jgi:hypothetical protein
MMFAIALSLAKITATYAVVNPLVEYWASLRLTKHVAKIWVDFQTRQEQKAAAMGGIFLWLDDSTYGFAIPLADDPDTSEVTHDAERTHR